MKVWVWNLTRHQNYLLGNPTLPVAGLESLGREFSFGPYMVPRLLSGRCETHGWLFHVQQQKEHLQTAHSVSWKPASCSDTAVKVSGGVSTGRVREARPDGADSSRSRSCLVTSHSKRKEHVQKM